MRLQRQSIKDSEVRGKWYFNIIGKDSELVEKAEHLLRDMGWEDECDGCPLYEDGESAGFWIYHSDVDQFKADWKIVKSLFKENNMIFVFEFMNDEFDYAIFNALHNPDLNEFNEMFSDALSMSEEYCGECQRVCVTVFENKEKTYEELFFDANKATEWFIERGFA